MADSQVPWGVDALVGAVSEPGWRVKLCWYLVATDDRMIPPPAQRAMAERAGASTTEVSGSHAVYVSKPGAVADLIKNAVDSVVRSNRTTRRPDPPTRHHAFWAMPTNGERAPQQDRHEATGRFALHSLALHGGGN